VWAERRLEVCLFFKGKYRAVLINYPTPEQKDDICRAALPGFQD